MRVARVYEGCSIFERSWPGGRAQAGNWDVSRPAGEKGGGRKLTGVVGIGGGNAEPEEVAEGAGFLKGVSAGCRSRGASGKSPSCSSSTLVRAGLAFAMADRTDLSEAVESCVPHDSHCE